MDVYTVQMVFQSNILEIGSAIDGRRLDELIDFDESRDEANTFYLTCIPRIGEIIQLPSIA